MVRSFDGPSSANDEKKSGSSFVAMLPIAIVYSTGGYYHVGRNLKGNERGGKYGVESL